MRSRVLIMLAVLLLPVLTRAQTTIPAEENEREWEFSASAYLFFVPDDDDYVQPTFRADRDWLHLEARYNYEDHNTTSVWVGYNLSTGDDGDGELSFDFTAMVGGVFGDTHGVAPGYEFTLAWRRLQLYSEAEYVFDSDESSESFFYTWSELTYSVTDWLRVGGVIQRTKVSTRRTLASSEASWRA
jgi:hypothetical protein